MTIGFSLVQSTETETTNAKMAKTPAKQGKTPRIVADGEGFEAIDATSLPANELHKSLDSVDVKSGALRDENGTLPPDLAIVVSTWKSLSESDREAVLAIIREAVARAEEVHR